MLFGFFLVALPFDAMILYTSFRSPQEAKAIATNQTYFFLSKLGLFVVVVNAIATALGSAWGFYYLSEMSLGLIEIFLYTFISGCLASQFLQIGSVYSFYSFLNELQ